MDLKSLFLQQSHHTFSPSNCIFEWSFHDDFLAFLCFYDPDSNGLFFLLGWRLISIKFVKDSLQVGWFAWDILAYVFLNKFRIRCFNHDVEQFLHFNKFNITET